MISSPHIRAAELGRLLARHCPPRWIDLAGAVALPCPLPHAQAWHRWLAAGYHAGLPYLTRGADDRVDPMRKNPWARSLLVFAQRYTIGWPVPAESAAVQPLTGRGSWVDGVARYARGRDYHDVLLGDVRAVLAQLAAEIDGLRAHAAVDTGPYLEREYAWLAGLGFLGKNCCLIHEQLGSGLFLAVALTNLEISGLPPAGEPAVTPLWGAWPRRSAPRPRAQPEPPPRRPGLLSRCGNCRRCLVACPTGALREPFVLDARLCISTWTIEWRGRIGARQRSLQGRLLFGCDICQEACPWNQKSARRAATTPVSGSAADRPPAGPRGEYATLPAHAEIELQDLLSLSADGFRRRFRRTPLWRAHLSGLRLNALTVAGNAVRRDLVRCVAEMARNDPDADVRDAAGWALARLEEADT